MRRTRHTIPKPSRQKAVQALQNPGLVRPQNPPPIPSDMNFDTLEDSARATLAYLAAARSPYYKGELFTNEDHQNSVRWRIGSISHPRVELVPRSDGARIEVVYLTTTFYYFDAEGNLLAYEWKRPQQSMEKMGPSRPKRIDSSTIRADDREELHAALKLQRAQIAQNWPALQDK